MSALIINGRAISNEILQEVKSSVRRSVTVKIVSVSPTAATKSYLGIKKRAADLAGISLEIIELPHSSTTEEVCSAIEAAETDAIVVQLPLPPHLDEEIILNSIPVEKDADVLTCAAHNAGVLIAPVAAAIDEVLKRANVNALGINAVVIGKGRLVGIPVAERLAAQGAHVSSYDKFDFTPEVLKNAQIVVSGTGVAHLIQPEFLMDGAVLIDAGTTERNGSIVGDIDPACAERAHVYTPVPGGIGPISVACLFRNVSILAARPLK